MNGTGPSGSQIALAALSGGKAILAFKRACSNCNGDSDYPHVSFYDGDGWTKNGDGTGVDWSTAIKVGNVKMDTSISVTRGMSGKVAELAFVDVSNNVQHARTDACTGGPPFVCSWTSPVQVGQTSDNMSFVAIAAPPPAGP